MLRRRRLTSYRIHDCAVTILCKPLRPLSWSYFLEGGGHEAIWKKRLTSEQGSFLIDDAPFEVQKRGPGSGTWLLVGGDEIHSTARKTSAFRRRFLITSPMDRLQLEPISAFGRTFYLGTDAGDLVAMISPKNVFSRKAEIYVKASDVDFPTIVFAFWLTVITWRRQAAAAGGG